MKRDVCEELLRQKEWPDAEIIARELVTLFTAAGLTTASEGAWVCPGAAENRDATAQIVCYVRDYVMADDPTRPFEPPGRGAN